jgi:hypothetical protein
MLICTCGDVIKDDESGHEDPSRDTHRPEVVDVALYGTAEPPDPKERAVAEEAARLVDEAAPPPRLTAEEREDAAREAGVEAAAVARGASTDAGAPE